MHYTPTGKEEKDRSEIGFVFCKNPPQHNVFNHGISNMGFKIPAGDGNHEVVATQKVVRDSVLLQLHPHMHLRGKDFELRVILPGGESKTLLKGNFDFEWQMGYQYAEPIALPKGSKLQLIVHFDNSAANRFNPDPTKKIVWGPQNWDEMSNCFIGVLFPTSTSPDKVFLRSGPSLLPRGESGPTLAAFSQVDPNAVGKATNASTGGGIADEK